MAIFAKPIERLIRELSKFPGVGEKTATRLALHILRSSPEDVLLPELAQRVIFEPLAERFRLE